MLLGCSMAIKSTLESRRRLQTSRKIQWAALKLALRYGYDDMTTEMIAAAAGISQRTFFRVRTSVTGPFQSIIFWRKTAARREAECRSLACPVAILCMPLSEITPGACFGPWSAQWPPT